MTLRRPDAGDQHAAGAQETARPDAESDLRPSRHLAAAAVPRLQALSRSLTRLPHRLRLLDAAGGEIFACGPSAADAPAVSHTLDIRPAAGVAHAPSRAGSLEIRTAPGHDAALIRALAEQAVYGIERDLDTHDALRATERLSRAERSARSDAELAERRFRDLVESLNAIVWEADARSGRFTFVSRRAEKILGYPMARWQDENFWADLVHPDDRRAALRKLRDAMEQGGSGLVLEHRVKAADGRTLWIRSLFDVLPDADGAPHQLRGLMLDITQRRRAEEAALRLAAIVESSEEAIIGKDLDGVITSWNAGAESMYGYTAEEAVGRHISMLSPPQRLYEIDEFMRKLRAGERITHRETRRVRKDGETIDVALTISPIRNPDGKIVGASTIARDITELKRAESTLRMTEKLAATGRLAASIAHEINNPMASITNLLYLLEHHDSLDAPAREYVRLAQEELSRVTHIVRQMLGFYREAEAPVEVSLKEVLDNILSLYGRRISNARVQVKRRYDYEGPIRAFPGEMRQVFSNLIINAVEAIGAGGNISVHVRRSRDWSRPGLPGVRVTIGDNGPGIAPEARRRIFEPFFTTKGERGTGLGLWVSEGILRKHGGAIRLRSSTDPRRHGTCFSVFLPLTPLIRRDENSAERVA